MSLPRYPRYKESGVDWLGQVPEHWEVRPCRAIVKERTTKNEGAACQDYLSLMANIGIIPYAEKGDVGNKKPEDLSKCKMVTRGDFVINSMNYGIGSYGLSEYDGVCSPVYIVLKPQDELVESRFAFRIFENRAFQRFAQSFGNGILEHRCAISWDILKGIGVCVPPRVEQRAILDFLDRETAKIGGLIEEQRRLMELLDEQIISLVLSSINAPDTVELRLSEASTIVSRPVVQRADEVYTRIGLFNRGRGLFHKDASEMDDMGESDFFWIEEGDLIISGQFAWEGAVALADKDDTGCVVSHRYPVLRGKSGIALTEYLLGLLCTKHGDFLLNENSRGAAGRNRPLNISSLMKERIPVPTMMVQKAVARAVHARKTLFKQIANAIELLGERRSALISAAVTGQIDVRSDVAYLPTNSALSATA
jgi:type I restriction enzyme S subunit